MSVVCVVDTECSGSVCGVNLTEELCTGSDGCKQSTCELSVVCCKYRM